MSKKTTPWLHGYEKRFFIGFCIGPFDQPFPVWIFLDKETDKVPVRTPDGHTEWVPHPIIDHIIAGFPFTVTREDGETVLEEGDWYLDDDLRLGKKSSISIGAAEKTVEFWVHVPFDEGKPARGLYIYYNVNQ